MHGVMGAPELARQDAVIGTRRTQRLGVRWRRSTQSDGSDAQPFDMSGYSGALIIASSGGDLWLSKRVTFDSEQGLVAATIVPSDTEQQAWKTRTIGVWSIRVTAPDGEVTVLVAGVMRIIQNGTEA